jgi:ERCC4-related helicase
LRLTLPIYSPLLYVLPIKREEYESEYKQVVQEGKSAFFQSDREKNLVNLMRVNLLKRLESSVSSFAMTLERILSNIDMTLEKLDRVQDLSELLEDMDDEDIDELEIGKTIKVKLKDMDQIKYRDDLEQDKVIIESMLRQARSVQPHDDAKLRRLIEQIEQKILNPINEHNRKVIVFTAFSDTAVYLYEHIEAYFLKTHGIHTGIVTGSSLVKSNIPNMRSGFEEILAYFSPKSSKMNQNIKEIDLLIATDCISEGQNLQDCDYLINYDIHWNPVRIIQRFGRIDRIGSTNKQIQLVNFWPNMELDEYINLENRVRDRMVMVDITATGEDDLLSDESKNLKYRSEQLKQLQNDVVDLEDLSGGISITDLTLDEFLMALGSIHEIKSRCP